MAEKKEGATTKCKNCNTPLVCRKKDYGGDYQPTLQWQNSDGTAHYHTTDGKNFNCNIPDDDSQIPDGPPAAPLIDPEIIEHVVLKIDSIEEMLQAIFRCAVDQQLEKK